MGLEAATYINGLVATNPAAGDQKSQGDDHIRLIKAVLQATFPNLTGAVNPTQAEINFLAGVTSAIQTQLNAKLAAALFPNVNAAANPSDEELNFLVGVTSDIQTQLNAKLAAALFPNVNAAANPSDEELNFLVGVTSAVQTQLNSKATQSGVNTFSAIGNSFSEVFTAAKGLTITGAASADPKTLDYYEEALSTYSDLYTDGTFTGITYTSRANYKTRIGRMVFAQIWFEIVSKSGTGNAYVTNWDTGVWRGSWTKDVVVGTWVANFSGTRLGGEVVMSGGNLYMLKHDNTFLQFNDAISMLSLNVCMPSL